MKSKESEIDAVKFENGILENFNQLLLMGRKIFVFHDILPRGHSKIMLTRPIKAVVFDDSLGTFVAAIAHDSTALNEEMFTLTRKGGSYPAFGTFPNTSTLILDTTSLADRILFMVLFQCTPFYSAKPTIHQDVQVSTNIF